MMTKKLPASQTLITECATTPYHVVARKYNVTPAAVYIALRKLGLKSDIKKLPSNDILSNELHTMSQISVAKKHGVSATTVYRAAKRLRATPFRDTIKRDMQQKLPPARELIAECSARGSRRIVAQKYGVPVWIITEILHAAGIVVRRNHKNKNLPPDNILADDLRTLPHRIVAEKYGVSAGHISHIAKRLNIKPIRTLDKCTSQDLKSARKNSHMTHAQFATHLGISERTLESWMYERGIPPQINRILYLALTKFRNLK